VRRPEAVDSWWWCGLKALGLNAPVNREMKRDGHHLMGETEEESSSNIWYSAGRLGCSSTAAQVRSAVAWSYRWRTKGARVGRVGRQLLMRIKRNKKWMLGSVGQKLKRNSEIVFEVLVVGLNGFKRYFNLNESF
jgi:hypothetical protein